MNSERLVKILFQRWQRLNDELMNCRTALSVDAVHDLRVAIRRFIAMLDFLKMISPNVNVDMSKRELKEVLRLMGPLRDIHVQQELLQSLTSEQDRHVLGGIWRQWRDQEKELADSLKERIGGFQPQHSRMLVQDIQNFAAEIDGAALRPKVVPLLEEYYQRIRSLENKALHPLSEKKLHRMRIAFKKFRYTCEILANGFLVDADTTLRVLKEFQSILGDIHDLDVLRSIVGQAEKEAGKLKDRVRLGIIQANVLARRIELFKQFLVHYGENIDAIAPDLNLIKD